MITWLVGCNRLRVGIDIAGQLDDYWRLFCIAVANQILIVVIHRILGCSRYIVQRHRHIIVDGCKVKGQGIFLRCFVPGKYDPLSQPLRLIRRDGIVEQLRHLQRPPERAAFGDLGAIRLRDHRLL